MDNGGIAFVTKKQEFTLDVGRNVVKDILNDNLIILDRYECVVQKM